MSDDGGGLGLIVVAVGVGALTSVGLLLYALSIAFSRERRQLDRRLARVQGKDKGKAVRGAKSGTVTVRLEEAHSSIRGLDAVIKRLVPQPIKLRERLAKTGRRISIGEYGLASLSIAALTFAVTTIFGGLDMAVAFPLSVALGIGLPHLVIGFLIAQRLKKFTAMFPEAIDLIVRGLRSGLPVTESIKIVGRELPDPIGIEFRRISDAFGIGQTLDDALASTVTRLDTPEFRFFIIALSVQRETGGNLAETLENLSGILRRRKQMKLKIRALSSEAKASAIILGSLPFILFAVLSLIDPSYTMTLVWDPRGHVMLGMAFASLMTGISVMVKMARFEI